MPTKLLTWSWLVGVLAALLLAATSQAQITSYEEQGRLNTESHVGKLTGHAQNAAADYRRYCVGCHGDLGDGNGENAPWLDPKPRDFTLGIFKCRSTPTGTLPADQDLYDTIGRGLGQAFLSALSEGKTGSTHRDSRRTRSYARARQGWAGRLRPRTVLEMPRRRRHGQRSIRFHSHRRLEPSHSAL
jgi:cytochrome c553